MCLISTRISSTEIKMKTLIMSVVILYALTFHNDKVSFGIGVLMGVFWVAIFALDASNTQIKKGNMFIRDIKEKLKIDNLS